MRTDLSLMGSIVYCITCGKSYIPSADIIAEELGIADILRLNFCSRNCSNKSFEEWSDYDLLTKYGYLHLLGLERRTKDEEKLFNKIKEKLDKISDESDLINEEMNKTDLEETND